MSKLVFHRKSIREFKNCYKNDDGPKNQQISQQIWHVLHNIRNLITRNSIMWSVLAQKNVFYLKTEYLKATVTV